MIVPQELFQEFIDVLTTYVEVLEKNESTEGGELLLLLLLLLLWDPV